MDRKDSFTTAHLILLWVPFQIEIDVDEGAESYIMKPTLLNSSAPPQDATISYVVVFFPHL